jgi:branched-subunit amino acid aminotransferase/4-amino-4-deoxychorismate lyase
MPVQSVKLKSMRTQVMHKQPILTGKTFHYAFRLQTGQQAHQEGFDTALMLDASDNVLEAAHANIFLRLPEGWITPAAESGLFLPGTVRQHLLQNSPVPIKEQTIPKSRLHEASEVFLTNSNVGIVPVSQIDDKQFPIGTETLNLVRWLQPEASAGNAPRFTAPPV